MLEWGNSIKEGAFIVTTFFKVKISLTPFEHCEIILVTIAIIHLHRLEMIGKFNVTGSL